MPDMKPLPMRMAFRVEGSNWCAYMAKPDTMVGAIFIGSIAMRFIEHHKERKELFMAMMQDAMGEVLAEMSGSEVTWNAPTKAPEHERSKS